MRLIRNTSGAIAVITAMVMPLLFGMGSLGVEVGHWYLQQRVMQGAADAAAISAAVQYIADQNANNSASTVYQTVAVNYASLNGYTIPTANVCVIPVSGGDNCDTVRSLDGRPIICHHAPCIVVEITQDTFTWLTTRRSVRPTNHVGQIQQIPTPIIKTRAIVSAVSHTQTQTSNGTDCVLALANDAAAVTVAGGGDIHSNCGIAIDGGKDQYPGTPAVGGITFNGSGSKVNISSLIIAAASASCPGPNCFLYNPSTSPLPAADVFLSTPTPDPYAATVTNIFATAPPLGAQTAAVSAHGSGYTNGTRTLTVTGGTATSPTKILATVSGGKVTAILGVFDPGAYTTMPTNPVSATPDSGGGSGVKFTLTEGCFAFPGTAVGGVAWTPIPGRKYCSIFASGQQHINFPAGTYWVAGGDGNCVGICMSSTNASMTSDAAGVTFLLTNGEGTGTFGTSSYATLSLKGGTLGLCAPNTNCGTTCANTGTFSCLLIVQNPAAPASTAPKVPGNTDNIINGNGTNTLGGLIYLSKQTFDNTGSSSIGGCFGVVAKFVYVSGTPTFSDGCLPGNGIGGGTTTVTLYSNPYLYQ